MRQSADVPRVLEFVTVKRNVALAWRSYGHWWIELDATESYGWWPTRLPIGAIDMFRGVPGVLNAVGVDPDGTLTRDPNHGLTADHEFHPVLVEPRTDQEVRTAIRRVATAIRGEWRWSARPALNCHTFQLAVLDAAGIVDGTGNYHTRGGGCPVLAPGRRWAGRLTGRRRWPGNLPRPGQRLADLDPSLWPPASAELASTGP